jgi:phosphate transport system substrate-binding protein
VSRRSCKAGILLLFSFLAAWAAAEEPLAGKLVSIGSDTLGSLTSQWAERLTRKHPRVLMQVRAVGSGAAPTALIEGAADIGPMSRPMSGDESKAFQRSYGYAPTAIPVAVDELALFVHRDNPLDSITLPQLDAIFSVTRRCGHAKEIRDWASVGLGEPWADRGITVYGRSAASGTYSVFRRQVLCDGDFSPRLNRLVGSSAIVRAVAMDLQGIGYSSAGYVNANVKRLRVLESDGVNEVSLSRRLFVYINRPPGEALTPLMFAFLNTVFSVEGQRDVVSAGYSPLSRDQLSQLRAGFGLDTL